MWDPYTEERLRSLHHTQLEPAMDDSDIHMSSLRSVCFSPEGLYLATVADDGLLRIWALELTAPVVFAPMTNDLCCTFFPHGGIIATGYVCALNRWADSVCTMKEVWRTVMPFIDVSNQCKGKERPVCGPCYLNGQLHKEA